VASLDNAIFQWQDGQRRLRDADPADRPALERVVQRIVEELRRRLGGSFTTAELANLYEEQGTDWCLDVALSTAPDNPRAWDAATVADAAFALYVRAASDYAGGRPVPARE
jgi:hypothetical protein